MEHVQHEPRELTHGDLISGVFSALGRFRRQVRRLAGRSFDESNLNASQSELLRLVGRNPGMSVRDAAGELGLAPNSVSTLVTSLVGADLMVRQQDPEDRRIGRLTLTDAAQQVADDSRYRRHELLSAALDELSAGERAELEKGMRVIAKLTQILHAREQDEP